jgi:hypothetical protein
LKTELIIESSGLTNLPLRTNVKYSQDSVRTEQESANQTPQDRRGKSWLQHLGKVAGPVVFVVIGFAAISIWLTIDWYSSALSDEINPVYVGKNECIGCHQQEAEGIGHSSWVLAQRPSMGVMLNP